MENLTEETNYYPFGLTMSGISSKAVGKVENKFKFNGYEENKSFELNWLESFCRTYDPQLGRFWQVDPKPTENISTYVGMSNNPMLIFDKLGDTGKIGTATASEVRSKGTTYKKDDLVNTLVNEWSKITGLKLSVDNNGNLVNGGVATNRGISRSARQEVLNLITSAGTVYIDFGSISSQGLEESDGQTGAVVINPGDIDAQVSGTSSDLNKMTFGLGMTVLHELGHTYLHNDFSHSDATLSSFGTIDETDIRVNRMRRELGANWGQRLSYTSVPFLGGNYIPMTNASLRTIRAAIPAIEHALMQNPMVQANELSKIQMPTSGVIIVR
jgi:RHS repeat-associated protein